MKRPKKVVRSYSLDEDVVEAMERYAIRLRVSVSALLNVTMAEKCLGDSERDLKEDKADDNLHQTA